MTDNNEKFNELRKKYPEFIYDGYSIIEESDNIILKFNFRITNLTQFNPEIKISKKCIKPIDLLDENIDNLVFHIGLIELISYWKATCSPNVIINCGSINEEQINWLKKLYFYGLGELLFINNIKTDINTFMNIECKGKTYNITNKNDVLTGCIIPVGGGKDSIVTLEAIKNIENNYCLIVNPKEVNIKCAQLAGYEKEKIIEATRNIDKNLLELNKRGYINGHTPFSAFLAFFTYFVAYITNKKYIVLSNESSANESNVKDEKINHQYSKTYEFENDFNYYSSKYLGGDLYYFSLLRGFSELQIAKHFSTHEKYFGTFKSCNIGSKNEPWEWCCKCPKCLFVFTILSPFLYKETLVKIFGEDLFDNKELLDTFIELSGYGQTKPFECVGTFDEVKYAITKTIENKKNEELPYLLKYYKDNYELYDLNNDLIKQFNIENNIPKEFLKLLEKEGMNG